jgi:hypothetical protein
MKQQRGHTEKKGSDLLRSASGSLQGKEGDASFTDDRPVAAFQRKLNAGLSSGIQDTNHDFDQSSKGAVSAPIQRIKKSELIERGKKVAEKAKTAPKEGVNLWKATFADPKMTIFLLGTNHGLSLMQIGKTPEARAGLMHFLQKTDFTHVFNEMEETDLRVAYLENAAEKLEEKIEADKEYDPEADRPIDRGVLRTWMKARGRAEKADVGMADYEKLKLDRAYLALASRRPKEDTRTIKTGGLETKETRETARKANVEQILASERPQISVEASTEEVSTEDVRTGNQQMLFEEQAKEMMAGIDLANAEERNRQWVDRLTEDGFIKKDDVQLWIVGAAHLPGLIIRLEDLKWKVEHLVPEAPKKEETSTETVTVGSGSTSTGAGSGGGLEEID